MNWGNQWKDFVWAQHLNAVVLYGLYPRQDENEEGESLASGDASDSPACIYTYKWDAHEVQDFKRAFT